MTMTELLAPGMSAACGMMPGMSRRPAWMCASVLSVLCAIPACGEAASSAPDAPGAAPAAATPRTITIGLVAKSQGNAVFQAAHAGALAAARARRRGRDRLADAARGRPAEAGPGHRAARPRGRGGHRGLVQRREYVDLSHRQGGRARQPGHDLRQRRAPQPALLL